MADYKQLGYDIYFQRPAPPITPENVSAVDFDSTFEDGSVIDSKIYNGAITTEKLHRGSVTDDILADLAVIAAKLATGSVTAIKIANLAVGNAAIANMSVDKLTTGTLKASTSIYVGNNNVKIEGQNKRIIINDNILDRILIGYQAGGF